MNGKIVVVGYGAVGKAVTELLSRSKHGVSVAQRSAPTNLPRSRAPPRSLSPSDFPIPAKYGANAGPQR
jgi:predicted dinucleotide-binding enzyme